MTVSRRDFMKFFGIGVASLMVTRCRPFLPIATCYAPATPPPDEWVPRERLRLYWRSFDELAQKTIEASDGGDFANSFGEELLEKHRFALDELVALGELTPAVADLVHEAYSAAVSHVWRSNAPITCYAPVIVNYAPASAEVLVQQSELLSEISSQGTVDPATLDKARAALEHDLAFIALSDAEVEALYAQLINSSGEGGPFPSVEELQLEVSPEATIAARYIVDLLAGK